MTTHTTGIEWTHVPGTIGATWNPVVGCSIVSPGCTNCYAMRQARRIEAMNHAAYLRVASGQEKPGQPTITPTHYNGTTKVVKNKPVWTGKVALAPPHILHTPLAKKRAHTFFVNSMGDLFHEDVPEAWIDRVFAVMALSHHHTFIVLTKRAARMRAYLSRGDDEHGDYFERLSDAAVEATGSPCSAYIEASDWPLPNVWLGVSAERQTEADARVPDLLATPAAVRFVSAEPLLGAIDFSKWLLYATCNKCRQIVVGTRKSGGGIEHYDCNYLASPLTNLDWIIVGGESGPDARPMHPDWARSIRDQCAAAGVPFFFKQWGEWEVALDRDKDDPDGRRNYSSDYVDAGKSRWLNLDAGRGFHGDRFHVMRLVGKARAGRLLDGREHTAWPSAAPGRVPAGESEGASKEPV